MNKLSRRADFILLKEYGRRMIFGAFNNAREPAGYPLQNGSLE